MAKKNDPIAAALAASQTPGMPAPPPVPPPSVPAAVDASKAGAESVTPPAPPPVPPAVESTARAEAIATGSTGDIEEETKAAIDAKMKELGDEAAAGAEDARDKRIAALERQVQQLGELVGNIASAYERQRAAVGFLNLMAEFVQKRDIKKGTGGHWPASMDDMPSMDDLPKMVSGD